MTLLRKDEDGKDITDRINHGVATKWLSKYNFTIRYNYEMECFRVTQNVTQEQWDELSDDISEYLLQQEFDNEGNKKKKSS
jgi:hypothetical protein